MWGSHHGIHIDLELMGGCDEINRSCESDGSLNRTLDTCRTNPIL